MICPACPNQLKPVKTVSHYGALIILDQCQHCGGIWVDRDELFKRSFAESAQLPEINIQALFKDNSFRKNIFCPKDKNRLEAFRDISWPKEFPILYCKSCGGFWFGHGKLKEFDVLRKKNYEKTEPQLQMSKKEKIALARLKLTMHVQLARPEESYEAKFLKILSSLPLASQASVLINMIFPALSFCFSGIADYLNVKHKIERAGKIAKTMKMFDDAVREIEDKR